MIQALIDELIRYRLIRWTLLVLPIITLLLLGSYHVLGYGRDDVYVIRATGDSGVLYAAPATIHREASVYTIYLFSAPDAAAPPAHPALPSAISVAGSAATPQPTPTATQATTPISITLVSASGLVVLPDQTLVFTLTPGLYRSYPISFINSPYLITGSNDLAWGDATLALRSTVSNLDITLHRENWPQMMLRRLILDSLAGSVLTVVIPALLAILAGFYARGAQVRRQFGEVEEGLRKLLSPPDENLSLAGLEKQVEVGLSELQQERRLLAEGQQIQLDLICAVFRQIYPFLKDLREGRADADAITRAVNDGKARSADVSAGGFEDLMAFLDSVEQYWRQSQERNPSRRATAVSLHCDTPFLNERLALLSQLALLDAVSLEDVKALLDAHEGRQVRLGQKHVDYLRGRLRPDGPTLPPWQPPQEEFRTKQFQLPVPVVLPFDELHFALNEQHQIIVVSGEPGSGKTTTLELLQKVKRTRTALYLSPVSAGEIQAAPQLLLVSLIEHALAALIPSNPWLKSWLDQGQQGNGQGDQAPSLASLSTQLWGLNIEQLCLAVDDAPTEFKYAELRQKIQSLVRQTVYLRVALETPPRYSVSDCHIQLAWKPEHLEELFDAIIDRNEGWSIGWHELRPYVLWQTELVRTPNDLLIWLHVLHSCYYKEGQNIDAARLEQLRAAMEQARARRSASIGWQLTDAEQALGMLRLQ